MSRNPLLSLVFGAVLLGASGSHAQVVNNSTVSGTLMSRSATVPVGETRAVVLEVPDRAHFILTRACMSLSSLLIRIPFPSPVLQWVVVGSELGPVPLGFGCNSFEPGVAFSPGEQISCEVNSVTTSELPCLVTGVLQREGRGRRPGR